MKKFIMWLAVITLTPLTSLGSVELAFTNKDMWALSRKLSVSLKKCKPLRGNPEFVVDVQNSTTEFVDKTQFSELIHSMLEKKTHVKPETKEPDFEIQAKLSSAKRASRAGISETYILSAEVLQGGEKLCAKSVKISKVSKEQNATR